MPLQISGKDLGALALWHSCPRCFWIQRRAKLPWQIFPGIFSSIDSCSKKAVHAHFDAKGRPEGRKGCEDCAKLDAVRGLLG